MKNIVGRRAGKFDAAAAFFSYVRKLWLVKSSAIFVGLGLVRGISQFVFVMVMTRVLVPGEYGIYSNFLYTTSILSPLFFLKSDVPVARYYATHPDGVADYIGTIVMFCSGITVISTLLLWFSQSTVQRITGLPGYWQMLILVTCWAYGLYLVVLAVLQIQLRAWAMSFSRILPNMSCELAAMGAVLAIAGGWRTALAAYTVMSAIWGIAFMVWLRRSGCLRFRFRLLAIKDFLHISLPLIPMAMGFMSVQISAQFVLTRYFGSGEVGVYAAANQFSLGVWLLGLSAQQAFLPWLFRVLKNDDRDEDYKVVAAVTGIVVLLALGTAAYVVIFKYIYPIAIGRTFVRGNLLLGQLAWANFFLGVQMVLNCFLYYGKQTKLSAVMLCLAAACGLALGIAWIPSGGARSAAYVTEIGACIAALLTAAAVFFRYGILFRNGAKELLNHVLQRTMRKL